MKRGLITLLAMAGAIMVFRKVLGSDKQSLREHCSEMCEKKLDQMPESFPPKKMFSNLAAIRKQTEQILELLQERESVVGVQ